MSSPPIRERNRAVLDARASELARRVDAAHLPAGYELSHAASGDPVLDVAGVALHSHSDPAADGRRWAIAACDRLAAIGADRAVVVGLGLGYHIEALAECFGGAIAIVEPDAAVWRAALASRDLAPLLERAEALSLGEGDAGERQPPGPAATARTRVLAYPPALLLPGGAHRRAVDAWQASAALAGLRLRVLVVSPVYGGSWPIAGYAARALGQLGHEVRLLDLSPFRDPLRALEAMPASRARHARMEGAFCHALGEAVVGAAETFEPDVVLALAQAPLGPETLAELGRTGAVRALWFVEDYRRFTYWRDVAPHYDVVLTIQDGECLDDVGRVTDGQVTYLPCACDPAIHRPLALDEEMRRALAAPVSFVGAGYRNRRRAFRALLDCGLRIWGSDWEGAEELACVIERGGERISTEESVRIFNATDVNLNLHSSTWHDGVDPVGDFVNPRTFELAACGAFQLVDRRRLLPPLFAPGAEIAVFDDVAGMRDMVRHYVARPEERRQLAERARRRALADHTYERRMQSMLAAVLRGHEDRLRGRSRPPSVAELRRRATEGEDRVLARLEQGAPLRLDDVARDVCSRPGRLSDDEAIFLFLQQFGELYLAEHRP